jgi:hypothetical protein
MKKTYDRRVGFSGHQSLSAATRGLVRSELSRALATMGRAQAMTSLAPGSDQIFAECALAAGGDLAVIVPCDGYEASFENEDDLARYRKLLNSAAEVVTLPFPAPGEEAYWAAGRHVVDAADILIAVWDGLPAGGLGGTADVVRYAEDAGKEVLRIWPAGASRK